MPHDVFLCYATEEIAQATQTREALEQEGVRCWMAARDIEGGRDYAEAILKAIAEAEVVVLLFSAHANGSPHVRRELERAVSQERPIVTVRIDTSAPSGAVEYYITGAHWLEAMIPPFEQHLPKVVGSVRSLLDDAGARPARPAAPVEPSPAIEPSPPRRPARTRVLAGVAVLGLIAAGVGGAVALGGGSEGGGDDLPKKSDLTSGEAVVVQSQLVGVPAVAVERSWQITGEDGDLLQGTTTLTNNSTSRMNAFRHFEVLPASLAPTAADVTFDREPSEVVDADPVFRWDDITLEPRETWTLRYEVAVEPGSRERDRVEAWLEDRYNAFFEFETASGQTLLESVPNPCDGKITITDVVGLGRDQASARLTALGLSAPANKYPTSEAIGTPSQWSVVKTIPSAGGCLSHGREVRVLSYDPDYCGSPVAGPCYDLSGKAVP